MFLIASDMLTDKDLEKISNLAKIKISPEEKDNFLGKMNQVFDWIEQLSKIDVSQVNINNLQEMDDTPERIDEPRMDNTRDELLSNTKYKKFDMFCVPKVVE